MQKINLKLYKTNGSAFWMLVFLALFFILTPAIAQTEYTLLAPIPLTGADSAPSQQTTAGPYIRGIFMLIIAIAGGLAVVMIIFGGIKYMSTDAFTGKNEAKTTIENAIWGLLLVIGAWLILYTINPKLVEFNLDIPSGISGTSEATGKKLSEQDARNFLAKNGITVNNNVVCPTGMTFQQYKAITGQGCTTLENINQQTLDAVIAFKNACIQFNSSCTIKITGGTELGRTADNASYASGSKIDIAATPITTAFIQSLELIGPREDGAIQYKCPSGLMCATSGVSL